MNDLPNLDLLRACAVLMVLFDHIYQCVVGFSERIAWIGRLGVLFFFVHTACVLMLSLERHERAGQSIYRDFYIRRIFRIYPLSIAAVFLVLIGFNAPKLGFVGWVSNFLLVQNITYSPWAFGTIWSLPYEVQMYVFLPFLFLLAKRCKNLVPLLLLWILAVIVARFHLYPTNMLSVFIFVPCFLPGIMAYWLFKRHVQKFPAWGWPVCFAAVALLFELHPSWRFPAWFACLALGLCVPFFRQSTNRMLNKITLIIAKYSYGIYLSHSVLLVWMTPTLRTLPLFLAIVALMAWLGFKYVENRGMEFGKKLTRKKSVYAYR